MSSLIKKSPPILLLIITYGFLLRVVNLTFAFPILYMSTDEASYHLSALKMIAEKTILATGNYGPLGSYVQIPFLILSGLTLLFGDKINSIAELKILVASQEGYFLFIPRIISAMFGTLTILITYRLSKLLFNNTHIAYLSSLLSAISLNLVFVSHQARPWSPTIFFSLSAAFFAIHATQRNNNFKKFTTLSMICSAIAFGFHQIGGLTILLCFLILLNANYRLSTLAKKMIVPILVFFCLITLLNYVSLGSRFFSILNPLNNSDSIELIQPGSKANFSLYLIFNFIKKLFLSDSVIILLFLPLFFLKEFRAKKYLPFKIFTAFNLFLSVFIFPTFIRYFLLAFSFFPVFAGATLYKIIKKQEHKYVFLSLVIIFLSFNSLYFNFLLLQDNTYSMMRNWVNNNIPPQTPIIATTYKGIGYTPVNGATLKIREVKPGYYKKAIDLIDDQYYPNVRFIIYADEFAKSGMSKADYTNKALSYYHADFIIDPYLKSSERLLNSGSDLNFELLAHFSPTPENVYDKFIPEVTSDSSFLFPLFVIDKPGPYFDILRVKN